MRRNDPIYIGNIILCVTPFSICFQTFRDCFRQNCFISTQIKFSLKFSHFVSTKGELLWLPLSSRKHANGFCRSRDVTISMFLPTNGLSLSIIIMTDLNHLMINFCKWFTSLYFYETRKPFACHRKSIHFKNIN